MLCITEPTVTAVSLETLCWWFLYRLNTLWCNFVSSINYLRVVASANRSVETLVIIWEFFKCRRRLTPLCSYYKKNIIFQFSFQMAVMHLNKAWFQHWEHWYCSEDFLCESQFVFLVPLVFMAVNWNHRSVWYYYVVRYASWSIEYIQVFTDYWFLK